ncbi:hypothetical protein A3J56_00595 [Candidatus Giovannonibacteria bacterium RIFCSPHIGHO2_02_FULL_46_20]|uniref:Uncharacterized protein n=1 Tax=Candidatus Giovannonibacteria bacterium RIFCSPHIGHO2_02_FULL_46_20 TaxID=1798338 RepID=A0A1F5WDC5_9BACT|nr:MAG: hypothetical protein A3J56_00595 [Candidatus Giovannonibacteria bacterium RIFCSPHIGHO2_02_FULL_46_20]
MNIRTIIAPLLRRAKTVSIKRRRVAIAHIWYGEVVVGTMMLIAVLGFDWYVYRSLVAAPPKLPQENTQKIVTLDEGAVKKSAEIMARRATFLEYPAFPSLIQNPF